MKVIKIIVYFKIKISIFEKDDYSVRRYLIKRDRQVGVLNGMITAFIFYITYRSRYCQHMGKNSNALWYKWNHYGEKEGRVKMHGAGKRRCALIMNCRLCTASVIRVIRLG